MKSVAVTGLGIVCPNGIGVSDYWDASVQGVSAIERGPFSYSTCLVGKVPGFVPEERIPKRLLIQTDISTQLALTAADLAISDSKIDLTSKPDFDFGVVTSNATGGFSFTHKEFQSLWRDGPDTVSVYESFAWFYAVNTGQISIRNGMRGPGAVLVSEQSGGLDALAKAAREVVQGTPFMLAGGLDSSFDPWGWVAHTASGRVSARNDLLRAYLPFDIDADGYVPGEGGALLALEDVSDALNRGADIYGYITGHASTFDERDASDPAVGLVRAILLALEDANVTASEVDVVFADGAGVPALDKAEAAALAKVFGARGVPVTAPKAGTGRLYSGGGPVDVACALLSMKNGSIPPTPNVTRPDKLIDLVIGNCRPSDAETVLVLARGRLGFNSALILKKNP